MAKAKKTAAPAASAPARSPAPPAASPPMTARSPAATIPVVRPMPRPVTREDIARRAYEIWVAKGRPTGQDLVNWQQAEKELLGH